jgi:hypothetical protein
MFGAIPLVVALSGLHGPGVADVGGAVDLVAQQPGSRVAGRVLDRLARVQRTLKTTKYSHRRVIKRAEGYYQWDCSSMVTWILSRAAPTARETLDRDRPVAVTYVRAIKAAPTRRARDGWRRLRHIEDVRPGDIFAWKRPPDFPSRNTGHVGFVLAPPVPVPGAPGAYKIRIADASSYLHEDDTRDPDGEGGFGIGTIAFMTDDEGRGTAYGWYGNTTRMIETPIVFGRVTR